MLRIPNALQFDEWCAIRRMVARPFESFTIYLFSDSDFSDASHRNRWRIAIDAACGAMVQCMKFNFVFGETTMDPSQLAAELTKLLTPYLPYLVAGGGALGTEIAKGAAGETGKKIAEQIWSRLRPKVHAKEAARDAIADVAKTPDDADAQNNLRYQLKKLLSEDAALANELQMLIVQGDYNAANIAAGAHVGQLAVGKEIQQNIYNYYQSAPGRAALDADAFNRTLKNYLEWVLGAYGGARLYGLESLRVSGERPVRKLADVFVPITLRRFRPPAREEMDALTKQHADHFERARAMQEWTEQNRQEGEIIELRDLLAASPRLAIIGGAGSGKSTLLAYFAAALAAYATEGQPLPFQLPRNVSALVPLIIPLRYLREYQSIAKQAPTERLHEPRTGDLAGFIRWYLERRYPAWKYAEDFFDRLLLGGGCLVMLDGLDEVVTRGQRARVRYQVEEFANALYAKNRYIVTAREAGYDKDAVFGDDFKRYDAQPLESAQIETLVANWCVQLFPNEVEARTQELTRAIETINQAYLEKNLPPLISTPLLTTMVVSVKFGKITLPRDRAKLYEAAVEVILQAQYMPDDLAREELVKWGGEWDEQREWLSELALAMQRGGRAGAAIPEERVCEILASKLQPAQLDQFIETVRARGGLFEERAELFQFIHLTFQEFLAARKLAKDREKILPTLLPHLTDAWWREVLLLLYGFAKSDYKEFGDKYLEWLSQEKDNATTHLAGLEIAGAALLDIEAPDPARQAEIAKHLARVIENPKLSAPAILRVTAGNTLARLGDPRVGVSANDFVFCEIPAGTFTMGSQPNDPQAFGNEQSQIQYNIPRAYYITRYPITNVQFDAFVEAKENGYQKREFWTDAGWAWRGTRERNHQYGGVFNLPNHPVVGVTWYEAVAFCRWLYWKIRNSEFGIRKYDHLTQTARLDENLKSEIRNQKFQVRLPSEPEWEYAARGTDVRIYPWNGELTPEHANYDETKINATSAVGAFPLGASPFGVLDMSGNVWEWCSTEWTNNYENYKPDDDLEGDSPRVLRGGSFVSVSRLVRCAVRGWDFPDYIYWFQGFRVCVAPV
jgi:formylglycine-generating enzyme required for sulfatase activity